MVSTGGGHRRTAGAVALLLVFSALFPLLALFPSPVLGANAPKNMTFYLHYVSNPPTVGGTTTNYVFNTANHFQSFKNNDYKAVGQPKIVLDFYLAPALAGGVTLNGVWEMVIFANSTALHPATWGLEFWEKGASGAVLWDSGAISPTVTGGPSGSPGSVDSPVYGYTLSTSSLSHTLQAGSTLQVELTINTGSTVPLRVWYDSPYYPSRLVLPSEEYATPAGVVTEDANGTARSTFFTFWRADQRQVVVKAPVIDQYGGYDIARVLLSIIDPAGRVSVDNASMLKTTGTGSSLQSGYSYAFNYSSSQIQGNYTVRVYVVDNNGLIKFQNTGTYSPFVERATVVFSLGIQYQVTVNVVDSHHAPLAGAVVSFVVSGVPFASGKTGPSGSTLFTLSTGVYQVSVTWEGVVVANESASVVNKSSITIVADVFSPTIIFRASNGAPVSGVLGFFTYPNGTTGRLPLLTGPAGSVTLYEQPQGAFGVLSFYEGVKVADTSVNVASDGPYDVYLSVYLLKVNLTDSSHHPLVNGTVFVKGEDVPNNLVFRYGTTATDGVASFLLPSGNYTVNAEYHSVYWLSYFSNSTSKVVDLTSNEVVQITMTNVPPPVWTTLGFDLVLLGVIAVVSVAAVVVLSRRRR